ncbi:MAG: pyrroline-5-carboxylate reductase [Ruminococcaceae bacterium]|nr:pyrroline-5-carboxylate reductase [Oscillospiraceae bacterium]
MINAMKTTIGCIGAGNIVRAILSGVEKSENYKHKQIGIFDISQQVCEEYKANGYYVYKSIEDLVKDSRVVVVAVLPQIIKSIVPQIKGAYTSDTVFISLAAGINNQWYEEQLGENCKVVQCVPTLTAQAGMGAFAVSRGANVTDDDYKEVYRFLTSCGIVEEIPESLMYEVVPINGAAPAYFYHMADVVVKEAVKMGLNEDTALRLFAQTMKGSAEMLLSLEISPKELESKLLLPGAATLSAINKMHELGFEICLKEGIKACVTQCRELGKQ